MCKCSINTCYINEWCFLSLECSSPTWLNPVFLLDLMLFKMSHPQKSCLPPLTSSYPSFFREPPFLAMRIGTDLGWANFKYPIPMIHLIFLWFSYQKMKRKTLLSLDQRATQLWNMFSDVWRKFVCSRREWGQLRESWREKWWDRESSDSVPVSESYHPFSLSLFFF